MKKYVLDQVLSLESLISSHDYKGFDPYDLKGSKFFLKALSIPRKPFYFNILRKLVLAPLVYLDLLFPTALRFIFHVKPKLNCKGLGLIAHSYFNLYTATNNISWLKKGENCLRILLENRSSNYNNPCWGYPFDWDSGVLVPSYTPTAVVTSAVFDAFWLGWNITRKNEYLDICLGICNFFCDDLNISECNDDTLCFSYTPLDNFKVHNINLMVSYCLLRVGETSKVQKYTELALKAADFTIREQNDDGSIYYWAKDQNTRDPNRIDHYHSGFEIRALWGIWETTKLKRFYVAFEDYYAFYRKELFYRQDNLTIPKTELNDIYPINIHSCAESILLAATLAQFNSHALDDFKAVLPWVHQKMLMKSGWFRYLIRKIGPFEVRSNIVYMRWGQAWMFLALTQALLVFNSRMNSDD